MVVGYSLGRAFLYSTPEYAILKLPPDFTGRRGAICGIVLCFACRLASLWDRWSQSAPFSRLVFIS